jgi:molybdate-binding protein
LTEEALLRAQKAAANASPDLPGLRSTSAQARTKPHRACGRREPRSRVGRMAALPGGRHRARFAVMGLAHCANSPKAAEIAGFHVPIGRPNRSRAVPALVSTRRDRLIRFVDRDWIDPARGNPAPEDLTSPRKLRFVNRQRGSGTRLLIDRLIDDAKIDASALSGYGTEEFTHPAVAATVASGGADAGFGLRAAAADYGLAFVPLVRERYFLAVRAKDAQEAPVARLIEALRSPEFGRLARRLPGYDAAGAGSVTGLEALTRAPSARPANP